MEEEPVEKKVRVPIWTPEDFQDIKVRTGQSSIAGAGSGEFHMYNERTRRERERLAKLQNEDATKKELAERDRKMEELRRQDEERTAKNRAKRQKRKKKDKKDSKEVIAVAASAAATVPSAASSSAKSVVRGSVSSELQHVSASVKVRTISRKEGDTNATWTSDANAARCLFALDGYSLYKFKDVAGDVRECMLTRFGDYILATPNIPSVWESVSATKLLEISVSLPHNDGDKPSHFSAHAPQHEGVFFVGHSSLAPEGSLRKLFALEISYSSLSAVGEHGKGVSASSHATFVLLLKGKVTVSFGTQTVALASAGEFVVCPAHEQVQWAALSAPAVVLAIVLTK